MAMPNNTRPGSAVSFSLTDPPPQRLGRAAELRRDRTHRRPLRAMLALMLENQPGLPVREPPPDNVSNVFP